MTNALLPALGGPPGRHARRRGVFFEPLPWALLVAWLGFSLLYLRHLPCLTTDPDNVINAYIRACYSDITANYPFREWAWGVRLLGGDTLDFAPLLAMLITIAGWFGEVIGWRTGAPVHAYTGLGEFFGATAILLFAAFLVTVVASALIVRREGRPWDVFFIAVSPAFLAAGLTSWDLFPLSLTAVGMAFAHERRSLEAGVLLGLAVSASTMSLPFALAVGIALLLAADWRNLAWYLGPFTLTAGAVHLAPLLSGRQAVAGFYRGEMSGDIGYGSLWYLMQSSGVPLRDFGALTFVLAVFAIAVLVAWLWVGGRRMAPGPLAAMILLIVVLLAPAYPPQTGIWVVFALLLARPVDATSWIYSGILAAHYLAVWARLGGHLDPSTTGPWALYHLAVLARMAFELGFLVELLWAARRAGARRASARA